MQSHPSAAGLRSLLTPIGKRFRIMVQSRILLRQIEIPLSRALSDPDGPRLEAIRHASLPPGRLAFVLSPLHHSPSRDQRQALNRWNRYVIGDAYAKEAARKYPVGKAEKKRNHNVFDLARSVHESESAQLHSDIGYDHSFQVTLEVDNFSEEKYQLFDNYQRHVHHESDSDISRAGFKRFLCSSPLQARVEAGGKSLGSFHQCYRLDGRLIAMGVLDLLPHSVSGVYFLYHSDFEKWSFGKLSALRELTLALENGYEHYYMGYYIHGCKKMRYKGDYKPQYVLDYDSLGWDVLDDAMKALMDRPTYTSMSRERAAAAPKHPTTDDDDDNDDDKETPEFLHPDSPVDAFASNLSLLDLRMPGVMPLALVQRDIALDDMRVSVGRGSTHRMRDMVSWHAGSETDASSFKGIMAEFAAAVGPVLARGGVACSRVFFFRSRVTDTKRFSFGKGGLFTKGILRCHDDPSQLDQGIISTVGLQAFYKGQGRRRGKGGRRSMALTTKRRRHRRYHGTSRRYRLGGEKGRTSLIRGETLKFERRRGGGDIEEIDRGKTQ
nr:arginyl-trna--protein transferase 1 [Quercus suber]